MNKVKCINRVVVEEISSGQGVSYQPQAMTTVDFPSTSFSYNPLITYENMGNCNVNPLYTPDSMSDVIEERNSPNISPTGMYHKSPQPSPETIKKLAFKSRYWESTKKNNSTDSIKNRFPFIIMSYNILAQTLLETHMYLYRNCDSESLAWSARLKKISNEIISMNPDILCLQEVETRHLDAITNHLGKVGYTKIFKQKTGVRVDGCAIFFKTDMFHILDCHSVEFLQPNVRLLDRDNIGIMVKLVPKTNPNSPFVVCTTHLLYNPRRTDVRLAQSQVFLAEIDRFSYIYDDNKKIRGHLPVIMTGDLNSFPNTPVTNLIAEGSINLETVYHHLHDIAVTNACQHLGVYLQRNTPESTMNNSLSMLYHSENKDSHKPRNNNSTRDYEHLFTNNFIQHNLNFTSVYDHKKENGEMEASTYQNEWVTVDYIYYSSSNLSKLDLYERYRLPTAYECTQIGNIPNSYYGSDHLSLAAKFTISQDEELETITNL